MATMLDARENIFRKVTSPGMESPPSPGRPAAPCLCLAISYSRYRLLPTPTGLLKRPHPSQDLQQPEVLYSTAQPGSRCEHFSVSALQLVSTLRLAPSLVSMSALQPSLLPRHSRGSGNPVVVGEPCAMVNSIVWLVFTRSWCHHCPLAESWPSTARGK